MDDGRSILTHSRRVCMKTCLRKAYYAYELGIRKVTSAQALRMGNAIHKGKELLRKGMAPEAALVESIKPYENVPDGIDAYDWSIEREKVLRLLHGHFCRYADDGLVTIAAEKEFNLPIVNPDSGMPTRLFTSGGKIDGIVKLPDGRLAVEETKSAGVDIAPDADYWRRLEIDEQITNYVYAARELGHNVACVLYDVIRKPAIKPCQVPLLDEAGEKVVLDADGKRVLKGNGQPRATGDKEKGWILQIRMETAQEYGDRLSEDIAARPEFYYQRKEIARLDRDIELFEHELWDQQQMLATCKRRNHWYRNTAACLKPYRCEFFELCVNNYQEGQPLPAGFKTLENVHPELEGEEE